MQKPYKLLNCIQNTWGPDFPSTLHDEKIQAIFLQGQNKNYDSYSGFYNDHGKKKQTGLLHYLKFNSIHTVFITGLALDFCVKATAIDAHNLRFRSYLVPDAVQGISPRPEATIQELKKLGILPCTSKDIFASTASPLKPQT
ncbi:isochorismatase family protein [Borrelia sp. P9F1]|uniref:isochorismatase family protein n=1 Tax=Borrelia sp. P9F1 TaxID=3058374 RepID=UPI00264A422F|nr:isochorismatase family protein [Borrelia sp. P9F1]WKC58590.1 isochorismatase family protein [Borrelia sp. P9F1]